MKLGERMDRERRRVRGGGRITGAGVGAKPRDRGRGDD